MGKKILKMEHFDMKNNRNAPSLRASVRKPGLITNLAQYFDRFSYWLEHQPWWQQPDTTLVEGRKDIAKEFGWWPQLACYIANKWAWLRYYAYFDKRRPAVRLKFFAPREKTLLIGTVSAILVMLALMFSTQSEARSETFGFLEGTPLEVITVHSGPKNWLDGTPRKAGNKAAVMGAYTYAKEAKYQFVSDDAMLESILADGSLVKLEGPYLTLHDVKYPYVMPVVKQFANRLAQQYAEQGCGKLVVTSALRTLEQQGELHNGSNHSVHPTGMSLDIRRSVTDEVGSADCLQWLGETLLDIEESRRIDVTFENKPAHFHVVIVPHVYESWLERQPKELPAEVKWLATALYFEAAFNESTEGYRAIGWAIRNRVRSAEYPNTILEVVVEKSAGRSTGGCQFSFMCDGKAERIQTLCTQPNAMMSRYWLNRCEERWDVVVSIAQSILAEPQSADPTGGAVLYYAASMPKAPYWAKHDMKPGTIAVLGSHVFACSLKQGDDACRS